jgi:hypothetical protein
METVTIVVDSFSYKDVRYLSYSDTVPECYQISIVVQVNRVLDILPVFRMLRIGVSVVAHLGTRASRRVQESFARCLCSRGLSGSLVFQKEYKWLTLV